MIRITPYRPRIALLLGADGPLGYYLARFLLAKGYEVHGVCRRVSEKPTGAGGAEAISPAVPPRLRSLAENPAFHIHHVDIADAKGMERLVVAVAPHEAYNLAADAYPIPAGSGGPPYGHMSFALPQLWLSTYATTNRPDCRLFHAVGSEAFDDYEPPASGWDESSMSFPGHRYHWPAHAHELAGAARSDGYYVARAILFPHASPMQSPDRWPRTLTAAAANYHINGRKMAVAGGEGRLFGDLGHTAEFAEACWRTLRQPAGGDWIIAQNNGYESDALAIVEERLKLPRKDWTKPSAEKAAGPAGGLQAPLAARRGNALKALRELGWRPERTDGEVVREMLEVDLRRALLCKGPFDEVEGLWAGRAGEEEAEAGGEGEGAGAGPAGGGEKPKKKATRRKRA